jgi:hypothetical protein
LLYPSPTTSGVFGLRRVPTGPGAVSPCAVSTGGPRSAPSSPGTVRHAVRGPDALAWRSATGRRVLRDCLPRKALTNKRARSARAYGVSRDCLPTTGLPLKKIPSRVLRDCLPSKALTNGDSRSPRRARCIAGLPTLRGAPPSLFGSPPAYRGTAYPARRSLIETASVLARNRCVAGLPTHHGAPS